ncbi:MAG: DNA-3-methyladenine glycosylase 2 family protein [Planktomarina sp.]|nr:DNA-3-methyladenine glycosylase 2 family protein [Planktomarina sp.]MDT2058308.1 DNA-3-methyladenine glycosylase 2 family protein [Planktomarina sp.]|tara:strand:- start:159 stop:758 length:600 start_codon:yes stop_codon:yes gene_type:complete
MEDIKTAVRLLNVPEFSKIFLLCGPIPLRREPPGFATLFKVVIGQQVSVASAAAIWSRLEDAGLSRQSQVARASVEELAVIGLSRPKIRYAHALSQNLIDYDSLTILPDVEVLDILTQITGIGRWTAQVYALTALGRTDVFPYGDLALQEATRLAFNLPTRPDAKKMSNLAQEWAPWRAVAARLLWAYYKHLKLQKEKI